MFINFADRRGNKIFLTYLVDNNLTVLLHSMLVLLTVHYLMLFGTRALCVKLFLLFIDFNKRGNVEQKALEATDVMSFPIPKSSTGNKRKLTFSLCLRITRHREMEFLHHFIKNTSLQCIFELVLT